MRAGLLGLGFANFYVLTGSVWLPILAHVALDILQGQMFFELSRKDDDATPEPVSGRRRQPRFLSAIALNLYRSLGPHQKLVRPLGFLLPQTVDRISDSQFDSTPLVERLDTLATQR